MEQKKVVFQLNLAHVKKAQITNKQNTGRSCKSLEKGWMVEKVNNLYSAVSRPTGEDNARKLKAEPPSRE